jgi:hypothetical protein
MNNKCDYNTVFSDFKCIKLKPNLYSLDVLGDNVQRETNSEWRKLGQLIARHISTNNQRAVLVSTISLDHLTSRFEYEGMIYIITSIDQPQLEHIVPDIMETEEFVFGLNVWLYFFEETTSVDELLHDKHFLNEIKHMISNLNALDKLDLRYELIAGVSNGCEILWFNPKRFTTMLDNE